MSACIDRQAACCVLDDDHRPREGGWLSDGLSAKLSSTAVQLAGTAHCNARSHASVRGAGRGVWLFWTLPAYRTEPDREGERENEKKRKREKEGEKERKRKERGTEGRSVVMNVVMSEI